MRDKFSPAGGLCEPPVYVDGVQVNTEFGIELSIDMNDVAAIEVYTRGSQIPLEYGGTEGGCGVILVWSKGAP